MRKREGHKAFSLIETMIVLFLTATMLYCVGKLTGETLSTLKFLQEKSATTESATLACQRLASELREAVKEPSLGGASVSFRKVIPSKPRLVGNSPSAVPTSWTLLYPPGDLATISYSQSGDKVVRQVGSEAPLEVATRVNTFAVTQQNGHPAAYKVALTIMESRRAVTFVTVVVCPGVVVP